MAKEFEIINQYFSFSKKDQPSYESQSDTSDVLLGIGDDAAVILSGRKIIVATDTLVEGVHFTKAMSARNIASRAVATNLSDFAAMGANPKWITLSLTLPELDEGWLKGFSERLELLCERYNLSLIGGDTTKGAFVITLTVMGEPWDVDYSLLLRSNANLNDDIWLSGYTGCAAAGLSLLKSSSIKENVSKESEWLISQYYEPEPRLLLAKQLREFHCAAIDISDGLLADANHIAEQSRVSLCINGEDLPVHSFLKSLANYKNLILAGGDDYELLFTANARYREQIKALSTDELPITLIGKVQKGKGVKLSGHDWMFPKDLGYQHF